MDNVFKNAWMSITRDKSSKPENYFSIIYNKINYLIKNPSKSKKCNDNELMMVESKDRLTKTFFEPNCQSNDKALPLFTIKRMGSNNWEIQSENFESYKKVIGDHRVGLGVTIDDSTKDSEQTAFNIKPHCSLTIKSFESPESNLETSSLRNETESLPEIRVLQANCKDLVQNYIPSSDKKDEKSTLRILSLKYDRENTQLNELEVTARKISFDDNNIHCQGSKLISIAPKNSSTIEKHDDYRTEDNQCERSRLASAKLAKEAQKEFLAHHSKPQPESKPIETSGPSSLNHQPPFPPSPQLNARIQNQIPQPQDPSMPPAASDIEPPVVPVAETYQNPFDTAIPYDPANPTPNDSSLLSAEPNSNSENTTPQPIDNPDSTTPIESHLQKRNETNRAHKAPAQNEKEPNPHLSRENPNYENPSNEMINQTQSNQFNSNNSPQNQTDFSSQSPRRRRGF